MDGPQVNMLTDNRRLHLHHGPIDLIIEVFGTLGNRKRAFELAIARFETLLTELVDELLLLRQNFDPNSTFCGIVARRMDLAVGQFRPEFITPMAAVAGAVADEILSSMLQKTNLDKAYVNNGGDTAFFVSEGNTITAGIATSIPARMTLSHADQFRGIATSGWRGRSLSLGIADSVCVIAKTAALADAAATMIANKINLPEHPAISRAPAIEIFPDSDLGDVAVTTFVGNLSREEKLDALASGQRTANSYFSRGIIGAALLVLDDQYCQIGEQNLIHLNTGELAHA